MMDFNSSSSIAGQVTALVDAGLQQARARQSERQYLGASRLGVACERALQFEYAKAPIDHGRDTPGRMLRIFERGHVMEDCMVAWLREAGFDLRTRKPDGEQFGFSVADGRLQGHIDGVIVGGPEGFAYPGLWECKCLGNKSWSDLERKGLAISKPIYAAQVAIYQAYLELHEHPAIFTALNADTMEIYTELVPFDAALAQRMSDRAVKVISATEAGDPLRMSDVCMARPLLEDTSMTDNTLSSTGIEPMIDAKQAAAALRLPYYWFADHAMRSKYRIPHYLMGGLVRYRLSELSTWAARNAAAQSRFAGDTDTAVEEAE